MSIAEIVILIVCLIVAALNLVRIVIAGKCIAHDIDQKTWERIEGWRK